MIKKVSLSPYQSPRVSLAIDRLTVDRLDRIRLSRTSVAEEICTVTGSHVISYNTCILQNYNRAVI